MSAVADSHTSAVTDSHTSAVTDSHTSAVTDSHTSAVAAAEPARTAPSCTVCGGAKSRAEHMVKRGTWLEWKAANLVSCNPVQCHCVEVFRSVLRQGQHLLDGALATKAEVFRCAVVWTLRSVEALPQAVRGRRVVCPNISRAPALVAVEPALQQPQPLRSKGLILAAAGAAITGRRGHHAARHPQLQRRQRHHAHRGAGRERRRAARKRHSRLYRARHVGSARGPQRNHRWCRAGALPGADSAGGV
eukprot:351520-Chlamydomonas_euryale.AAC.2